MIDPDRIRCEAERRAHRALEWLRKTRTPPAEDPDAKMRKLRAEGLFVTRSMAPEAFAVLDLVRDRLEIEHEVRIHQRDASYDNASCIIVGDDPIVQFAGGWLRGLPQDELAAVLGHELGHWIDRRDPDYRCTARLVDPETSPVARLFYLGGEVTADRFGLLASRSPTAAARLELRHAAGPRAQLVEDIDAYLAQARAHGEELLARGETTLGRQHPEHLLRTFVLLEFAESDLYAELTGRKGGRPFSEVEDRVVQLLTATVREPPAREIPKPEPVATPQPVPGLPLDADEREKLADEHAGDLLKSAGAAVEAVDQAILGAFTAAVPVISKAFDAVRATAEKTLRRPPPPPPADDELEAKFQELERRAREGR
ncbi:MAG: M48 family metalloprotease [Myxococcales bacterium]|nr:M48 family metalloprotease [Myxococcales bacterium]